MTFAIISTTAVRRPLGGGDIGGGGSSDDAATAAVVVAFVFGYRREKNNRQKSHLNGQLPQAAKSKCSNEREKCKNQTKTK